MIPIQSRIRHPLRVALMLRWVFVALISAGVLAGCAILETKEREWVFRPDKSVGRTPADYGIAFEDVWLHVPREGSVADIRAGVVAAANSKTAEAAAAPAQRVHGWWMAADDRRAPAVLYFHGSRLNMSRSLFRISRWSKMGFSVLAIDYRGFGVSDGDLPSEIQAYQDAAAAWAIFKLKQPDARRRFIFGHSLGGAVAIHLAADLASARGLTRAPDPRPGFGSGGFNPDPSAGADGIAGLILESTFTSIRDMVKHMPYGMLPIEGLVTQRFDSISKVAVIGTPVLFIHGAADSFVPPEMSERLFEKALEPKRLVLVPGAGHSNVAWAHFERYQQVIREFVEFTGARVALNSR